MWSKIWQKLESTVVGGAIIIASASIISRFLGLLRDRLLASSFGAGDVLDSYYAAFKIPDLIFNILVLGILSASFIPVFLETWAKDKANKTEEAWRITNTILNLLVLFLVVVSLIVFIWSRELTPLIAPGFSGAKQLMTAKLMRIMLLAIIFFGISNIFSGILNSFKKFMVFSLAPIMYNLGIIFGILVLVRWWGLIGLAGGVVFGAFLHLIVQLPGVLKTGWRWQPIINYRLTGVKKILKLMVPRAFGLGISQFNQLVVNIIASTLAAGSVAVFNLANNLQFFPISVFGVSLAIAAFPAFSEAVAAQDKNQFLEHFSKAFRRILFLIIPTSVAILLLRAQIVRVVLGAGHFDWEDTYLTAQSLGLFSLSLFAQSLIPLITRSFYAHQDTKTPVKTSLLVMILNISLALILVRPFGVLALPLSFSISSILDLTLLTIFLKKKLGRLDESRIIEAAIRIALASSLMGSVIWLMLRVLAIGVKMQTFIGIFLQGLIAGVVGLISYLIIAMIFRFDEVNIIRDWLIKLKNQLLGNKNNGSL